MKIDKNLICAIIMTLILSFVLSATESLSYKESSTNIPNQKLELPLHTATLSVVGDLMVHKEQLEHALTAGNGQYNFDYCFSPVKNYLSTSDYTIGNLETTFAGEKNGYRTYPVFNTPDHFAQALKNAGIDFVSTANNHCNDMGERGLFRTIETLDRYGIDHAGTYKSQEERDSIFIKAVNNIRFALLSYTFSTNGIPVATPFTVNMLTEDGVKADILHAKENAADLVIVCAHLGVEYATSPSQDAKHWAETMVRWGADIILMCHPHVLQPMEFITVKDDTGMQKEGFVIYSLGNFISHQRTVPRDAGIILNFEFVKEPDSAVHIRKISYIPTWVMFRNNKGEQDIKVLPVYDALAAYQNAQFTDLNEADIARLYAVHDEILQLYGTASGSMPSTMQREYVFYQKREPLPIAAYA